MKKNNKNRQVVMALTMAINASMLLNPVLAKAEGINAEPADKNIPTTPSEPTIDQKNAAATATDDALSAAKDAKENTVETVSAEEGYEKTVSGVAPAAEAVKEINENLFKENADDAVEQINGVISDLDKATLSEIVAGSADRLASGAAIDANKAGADVDKYAAEYEKQVNALSEKIVGVAETINNSNDAIDKATTKEEANKAAQAARDAYAGLADIEKDITDAETDYNGALSDYNTAKGKYDTAVAAYNQAKADYDELTGAAATGAAVTAEDLSQIRQDLSQLKHDAELNKNLLIIKEVEDKILAKNGKVDFYNNSVDRDKKLRHTEVIDGISGNVYVQELKKDAIANTENKLTYADYVNKIIALYYTDAVLDGEFDKLTWNRYYDYNNFTYTDENDNKISGISAADTLNYCEVSYREYVKDEEGNYVLDENGNRTVSDKVSTKYLNYKLSNNNDNKKAAYQGVVIFEKTDHLVLDGKDLKSSELKELEENGFIVDKNDAGEETRILTKTEDGVAKLDVTRSTETKNYDDNMVLSDETDEDGVRTVKEVAKDSEEKVSYEFADGKVTKSVEKGVTVTTYTNESLAALDKSLYTVTEDEAKEAFANALTDKLNLLNDGESLIIRVGEEDVAVTKDTKITKENAAAYGYVKAEDNEADGVYKVNGTFTKSVVVSGKASEENTLKAKYNYGDSLFDWQHATKLVDNDAVVVNGNTVTVEYEELKSVTVPSGVVNFFEDIFGGKKSEEEIRKILKDNNIVLPEGSIIFAHDAANGDFGTATIYYVEGNSCDLNLAVEGENPSEDEIKEAVKSALAADENEKINNLDVTISQGTIYGYQSLAYILKKVNENSETAVVSTEVFETVEKLATLERRNDNWYAGNIALATQKSATDDYRDVKADTKNSTGKIVDIFLDEAEEKMTDDFRNAIESAAYDAEAYAKLLADIAVADKLVSDASAEVDALSAQIKGLGLKDIDAKVNALTKNLDAAKEKLNAALAEKEKLTKALAETENKLAEKISALNGGGGNPGYYPNVDDKKDDDKKDDNEEKKEDGQTIVVNEDETAQGSAVDNDQNEKKDDKKQKEDKKDTGKVKTDKASDDDAAPVMDLGVGEGQALGSAVVNDADETPEGKQADIELKEDDTAQGSAVITDDEEKTSDDKEVKEEAKADKEETGSVELTEDATPEAPIADETVKPNFWWLLLILILGVTGEELYRRHVNKKKEAKEKVTK